MASDALVTRGLVRAYGPRKVLRGLDLTVKEGDVYGFLGTNGAGKTTAISCILGLIRRDEGSVEIFGDASAPGQRLAVGAMVGQPAFHLGMTARENLEQSLAVRGSVDGAEVDRVLELVQLLDRSDDRVRSFSTGMTQTLGIARALLGKPRLLILDEPTNGLDPRGQKRVRDLLVRLARWEDMTVFMSSHLLSEVEEVCTRVGILDGGRLVAEGRVRKLLGGVAATSLVEVRVADEKALGRAMSELHGAEVSGGSDGRWRVRLVGMGAAELNRRLVEAGVQVEALMPLERTLEDLFLQLTGDVS